MALDKEAYKALESVVGPKYVSDSSSVLVGYAYSPFGFYLEEPGKWNPCLPLAVVLPENTEQVQGIVKVCNRYDLKFKAHATGWGPWSMVGVDGVICIDLRRMNRIIEIDEKNMFAVIEPHVVCAQLQSEAMKKGLDCHIVSAGPNHSPLASTTSAWGIGIKGLTQSYNERNCFGVEWVLPDGELVRLGSPAMGAGWFSGDGPGPSLRGVMRGFMGAFGGNGVFTKIGYKLHPWHGEEKLECTGSHPQVGYKIPENMKFYFCYWPDWEGMTEAMYKVIENDVAFMIVRIPPDPLGWALTRTNDEFYKAYHDKTLAINRDHNQNLNVIIGGHSRREFEFRTKVFEEIVEATKGKILRLAPEDEEPLFANSLRQTYIPRIFRPVGDFSTSFGIEESFGLIPRIHRRGEELLTAAIKTGKLPDHGPEAFWTWPTEGRYVHSENAFAFDSNSVEAKKTAMDYVIGSADATNKEGMGMGIFCFGPLTDVIGPTLSNVNEWMRKIKNEVVDPQNRADHFFYVSPEYYNPFETPPSKDK